MMATWAAGRLLCLAVLANLLGSWTSGPSAASAQAPVEVVVDRPEDGAESGPELTVRGWAYARGQPDPGVDTVAVYLQGAGEDRGELLGTAAYGLSRPDVAASLGSLRLEGVGYELEVRLPPGDHWLAVYAHQSGAPADEGWSAPTAVAVRVRLPSVAPSAVRTLPGGATSGAVTVPPSVTGGTVCTNRAANGTCLAYTAANGGVAMVCSELTADGECTAYVQSSTVSTACARYGTGGQCLAFSASPAVNPPPGGVAQTTALCLGYNAVGQCTRYSNSAVPEPTSISLTVQAAGSGTVLSWSTLPAATTYEVLRCATAQLTNCSPVTQSGATSYRLSTRQNYWYAVRARDADGQVLATSNLLGPL
jgi:hypothetical protein